MIKTAELKRIVQEEKREKKEAVANFLKAFNDLKKLRIDVGYYNFYTAYTPLRDAEEFIFKNS